MNYNQKVLIFYLCYLFIISLITLILFVIDKRLAIKESDKRIKEKTLLFFVVLGGTIGAYFGRIWSHHKTYKKYFSFIINTSLVFEIIVLGIMIALSVVGK